MGASPRSSKACRIAGLAASTPPRITVVVPVYNGGELLERCLRAVLASDHTSFEVLVVDDGSTDDSAARAEALGCRVIRQANQGPATARNRGAAEGLGELILLLDADVCVAPDTLSRLEERLEGRPEVLGVNAVYSPGSAQLSLASRYLNCKQRAFMMALPELADTAWTACFLVRRAAFEACGGMDTRNRLPAADDLVLGVRLLERGGHLAFAHEVEVDHLKPVSARDVLRYHFVHAREWTLATSLYPKLMKQKLGQSRRPVGNTLLASALLLSLPMALVPIPGGLLVGGLCGAAVLWNLRFLAMLSDHHGPRFALGALPLILGEGLANAGGLLSGKIRVRFGATSGPSEPTTQEGIP